MSSCSHANISQGRGEPAARAVSLSFPSSFFNFNSRNFADLVQNLTCPKCWREEFSLTIFSDVYASPQKYCGRVRYWGICRQSSPGGQVCYLDSSLPHMPAWMYFQNYFLQVHTLRHEMEHLHEQQCYRRASHCFPGNTLGIFHHVCAWSGNALCVVLSRPCHRITWVSLSRIHGTGNFTPVFGTNWRALLPHSTAQVGRDIFKLPADSYGHGSSSCCDDVRAVNAIASVSRSLRCFPQGRRENECHTQQADVATWAQGPVNLQHTG